MDIYKYNIWASILKAMLLIFFCSMSEEIVAQETNIRFTESDISREEAFRQIEAQTPYSIAFNHTSLNIKTTILLPSGTISLANALNVILKDSECTYRINKKHIIIIPASEQNEDKTVFSRQAKTFSYTGIVFSGKNGKKLGYATVSLLDDKGKAFLSGTTDDEGQFFLTYPKQAFRIRISFIGYQTIYQDLETTGINLGDFHLEEEKKVLDEVIITTGTVNHEVDRNSYIVTAKMRQGVSNAQELLDRIHGVRFDKIANTIKVGSESSVLLLVDGMQQSQDYIKNLSPERIRKIEVITEPSGRFLSEGYSSIINFILKKEYTGYDISLRNFAIINPSGTNGNDWLAKEEPTLGFTYTKKNMNIYGMYNYIKSRWNTPTKRNVFYKNVMDWSSKSASTKTPNNFYKSQENSLSTGINYQIAPKHILSFQSDYSYNNIGTENRYLMQLAGSSNPDSYSINSVTIDQTKDNDYVGTVFYKGEISDRLQLYSDFSYNYYSNHIDNSYNLDYLHDPENKRISYSRNLYRENKKLTAFHVEGNYLLSEKISLNVGYSNIWRNYNSNNVEGENFLHYREYRNKLYLYLSLNPLENLKVKLGTALESIRINNKDSNKSLWSPQPHLQMNYAANKNLNINASYATDIYYPSLYQLSPMSTAIDTILTQVGNPDLKSAVRHTVSVRFTFWNKLSVIPIFKYTPERISEIYTRKNFDFFRTFGNVNVKQYMLQVAYDQPIGAYVNLKSMVAFYYNKARGEGVSNSLQGWLMDSEVNYYNPKHELNVSFGYFRGMEKSILLQGYQMVNMDNWVLSLSKEYWDKKLSVSFSYIPPIGWGVRHDQVKEIKAPDYHEKANLNLRTYNNMLFLRIGFRFNSGKAKRTGKETRIDPEEREKRTIRF